MTARIDELRAAGVTRVRVHYGDLLGTTRAKVIPLDLLEETAQDGVNFCVSVFAVDHQGVMPDETGLRDEVLLRDMQVRPDLATLRLLPWEANTAICLADCWFDGEPLPTSPRGILRRAIASAEERGYRVACGHELEFFLLRRGADGGLERYAPVPGLVYRMDPRVDAGGVIRQMEDGVRALGLPFVCVNQEYDPSQWEINCRYDEALKAADDAHLLKLAIKEIAAMNGWVATFMGVPFDGGGTSGYHLHLSFWDADGGNLFADPAGPQGLSDLARWFIGGQLEHARGITAVMAPTVNAYKRFISQALAPYWIDWGEDNRTTYIRLPGERGRGPRVARRSGARPPPSDQAPAAAIHAGLDGIDRKLDPGPPSVGVYEPPVERQLMPFSLSDALDALESDTVIRDQLGEQFMKVFVTLKRNEARRFSLAVTDWELREYLDAL